MLSWTNIAIILVFLFADASASAFEMGGFAEIRAGGRLPSVPGYGITTLGEQRTRLSLDEQLGDAEVLLRGDLLYDQQSVQQQPNFRRGLGFFDLREASVAFPLMDFLDLKIGRQVNTWGKGDLVFINDLFPKDWQSLLFGRDITYLKAPGDSVRLSAFSDWVNLDLVFTPLFAPDRFLTPERFASWDQRTQSITSGSTAFATRLPSTYGADGEYAARMYREAGGVELALYGYRGFWKSPMGYDAVRNAGTFPRLQAIGASAQGEFGGGIASAEIGYYDSVKDRSGKDPFTPNSEGRGLLSYERELVANLTTSVQYYGEWLQDYDAYRAAQRGAMRDEWRHLVSSRVSALFYQQALRGELMVMGSPSDRDVYAAPLLRYQFDDHISGSLGANIFKGKTASTFFGQFERNSNVYTSVRYSW